MRQRALPAARSAATLCHAAAKDAQEATARGWRNNPVPEENAMLRLFLAAPLALIALPAVAQDRLTPGPVAISVGLAKGCIVQQVHTPAGKLVHAAPIVTCDPARVASQPNATPAIAMK
jgi:hypothetical protein